MIRGAKFWNDPSRYYRQDNNPTEVMLKKKGAKSLETCGPTSAIMCLDAMGFPVELSTLGTYKPQPEEVLTGYFNDPRNYDKLKAIRKDVDPAKIPGNEVPQWYPIAVLEVFGVKAAFAWVGRDFVLAAVMRGRACQICLKRPGHFVAAVAYDEEKDEIIYHDPWPKRAGKGFALRMSEVEYMKNVQPYAIIYA